MNVLTPIYCLSAYIAVISHLILIAYNISGSPEIKQMVDKFNPEQKEVYGKIQNERRTHYSIGLGLGLLLASLFYGLKCNIFNNKKLICAFVGIATFVANMFYELMPKSYWMVEHLDNRGDVQRWNTVYKKFRTMTGYGELLGFALFALSHR